LTRQSSYTPSLSLAAKEGYNNTCGLYYKQCYPPRVVNYNCKVCSKSNDCNYYDASKTKSKAAELKE